LEKRTPLADGWRFGDLNYGSDRAGLVCAYTFAPGAKGTPITGDEAAAWIAGAQPQGGFLWLHFNLANTASQRWLAQHLDLPQEFNDLLQPSTSTRVEVAGTALVGVLNDVMFFGPEASTASTVTLFVDARMLVSARTTALKSIDRLRAAVKAGEIFRSPCELLAHLLRDQADVLVQTVRDATRQVDVIEDAVMLRPASRHRPKLGMLRRVLVRLQRLLAPEPATLFRLLNRPPAWVSVDDAMGLRQSAEELSAAVADSAALVERVRLIQEELSAHLNEQTNRTLFVLTAVTVLTLPMVIIPGLFGMNVGGVPFKDHPAGFWVVLGLVVGLVALGVTVVVKRSAR
jgi:zinc transporter